MHKLLHDSKVYTYEEKDSFKNGNWPCYYVEKKYGFIVFFLISEENIDYAVFNAKKELITLVENINFYNEEFCKKFIDENSRDEQISHVQYLIHKNNKK
ncbi:hypothetical protein LPB138_07015 [Urechidicola croceus]|uniref:Uncharacterized protein n=2 Tax=Urechidicola croceus TaxID=1850246 RepID=A0A1D8P786_9FLAO|nr:hypothetical protein LPB138_07015 [Urechidicola croceus]